MKFVPVEIVHRSAWLNCRFVKIIPGSQVIHLWFNGFFILVCHMPTVSICAPVFQGFKYQRYVSY